MRCQAWRRTELMSCDGWADNKTFSFHCIFTFTLPARVPSPFLRVMDCTDSGCDKVSLRCTCTLSFCSVSDVALRLRKVKNEYFSVLCFGCHYYRGSLPPGSGICCMYSSCSVTKKKSFKAAHLNLALDAPCWWSVCTCPSKAVAIQATLVSNFLYFSRRHANKHPLGNTVKVLLVLLHEKRKGSDKIPKHE